MNNLKINKKAVIIASVVVLVAVIGIVSAFFLLSDDGIALSNAGFEKAGKDPYLPGWTKYNYNSEYKSDYECTDFNVVESGYDGKALEIISNEKNDARVFQTVKVEENSVYKISVMIKTVDVDGGAGANISAYDCNGHSSGVYDTSDGWVEHTVWLTTLDDQTSIKLSLGLGGFGKMSKGTAYFDSLTVSKASEVPAGGETLELSPREAEEEDTSVSIWFKLLFVAVILSLIVYVIFLSLKSDKQYAKSGISLSEEYPKKNRADFIIILVLTVTCTFMSFYQLGGTSCASSYWKAANADEEIVASFDGEYDVSCIVFFGGIPSSSGQYTVYYEDEYGEWQEAYLIGYDAIEFYKWNYSEGVSFTSSKIKVYAETPGIWINEMAFFYTDENGEMQLIPIDQQSLSAEYEETDISGKAENLFDEQDTVPTAHSYMNGTYFDEIYFPRTAYEHLNGLSIYEKTHPPMGKVFMSIGIKLFGMNPFGWRFAGTVFGIMLVPLMYLFGLKVFKKRIYAFATAFLMMFDFMRLAQTRLATIDSYAVFFTLAMYYFMYDYFAVKSYDLTFRRSLKPLFLCGVMFGFGAASKWVCMYSGAGLAIIFFLAKYLEGADYFTGRAVRKENEKSWFIKNFLPTCVLCVLFFIVIPVIIYVLSYIPYMASNPDKTLIQIVIENQEYMYSYHSELTATHPYGSEWWTWPFIQRPIWYYHGTGVEEGMRSTIVSLGNPLIWWVGIPCIFISAYFAWRNRDKKMIVFYVAFVLQYAPWILIDRVCFIYHFFTSVPFIIFMIVYVFKNLIEKGIIKQYVLWIYLVLVMALFAVYYPVLTGIPVKESFVESLRLFSSWYF